MIYEVKATLNNSNIDYHVCYSKYKVYVNASSVEEAKIEGIKYISESIFCVDKSLAYSIFCMHRSSYEEFCRFFKKSFEESTKMNEVKIFWESIYKLQNLESLWDYETEFKDVIDAEFEKDIDQSILNCFYDFPTEKQDILLHELVYVKPLELDKVDVKCKDYYVA